MQKIMKVVTVIAIMITLTGCIMGPGWHGGHGGYRGGDHGGYHGGNHGGYHGGNRGGNHGGNHGR